MGLPRDPAPSQQVTADVTRDPLPRRSPHASREHSRLAPLSVLTGARTHNIQTTFIHQKMYKHIKASAGSRKDRARGGEAQMAVQRAVLISNLCQRLRAEGTASTRMLRFWKGLGPVHGYCGPRESRNPQFLFHARAAWVSTPWNWRNSTVP